MKDEGTRVERLRSSKIDQCRLVAGRQEGTGLS